MVGVSFPAFEKTAVLATVGRGVVVAAATLGVVALGAQLVLQGYFADKILPGVSVAGQDLGSLTLAQARSAVRSQVVSYRLNLRIDDKTFAATANELGVVFDVEATVRGAYQSRRGVLLPGIQQLPLVSHVDQKQLMAYAQVVAARIGTDPTNATLVVNGTKIETVPDKDGWSVDPAQLTTLIRNDTLHPSAKPITLASTSQPAKILAANVGPAARQAADLMDVPIVLNYNGRSFAPNAEEIGSWLNFGQQIDGATARLVAGVDEAKVRGYVQQVAGTVNVAPVDKKITIENGVSKVGREGVDGTAIDQDPAVAAIMKALGSKQDLTFDVTSHPVPFKTLSTTLISLDYGRYIEINLSKQRLWVWQDHAVIYETPITSGATGAGFPTVTGLFSIYYKTTNTHLRGYAYGPKYNYDVQVDYWMPFYSGYGLHDASWRNGNFGGSDYYYGGSHGCVNLPDDAAAFIYNWADVGTPVWVHN